MQSRPLYPPDASRCVPPRLLGTVAEFIVSEIISARSLDTVEYVIATGLVLPAVLPVDSVETHNVSRRYNNPMTIKLIVLCS